MEIQQLDYSCKNCTRYIGNGPNLWLRISNSSIIAEDPDSFDWAQSAFREDTRESHGTKSLEGSVLVTRSCADCGKRLGLHCVRAVKAEMRGYVNQYIVRAPAVTAKVRGTLDFIPLNIRPSSTIGNEDSRVANPAQNVEIANSTGEAPTQGNRSIPTIQHATAVSTTTQQGSRDLTNPAAEKFQDTDMLLNIIQRQQDAIDELTRNYENLRKSCDELRNEVDSLKKRQALNPQSQTNSVSAKLAKSMGSLPSRPSPLNPTASRTEDTSMIDSPSPSLAPPISAQSALTKSTVQTTKGSSIGLETQQYLQTTVADDDVGDSDYIPPSGTEQQPPTNSMVGGSDWHVYRPSTPSVSSQLNRSRPSRGRPRGRPRGSGSPKNPPPGARKSRKYAGLGTPEWEQDSWDPSKYPEGFQPLSNKKRDGGSIKRRGVSSIGASFQVIDSGPSQKKQKLDKLEKPRDDDGYLLMPNGQRDGRSLRGRSLRRKAGDTGKDSGTDQSQDTNTQPAPVENHLSTPTQIKNGLSQSTPNSWRAVNSKPQVEIQSVSTATRQPFTEETNESITIRGSEKSQANAIADGSSINGTSLQIKEEHVLTPPNHKKVMKGIFPHRGYQ